MRCATKNCSQDAKKQCADCSRFFAIITLSHANGARLMYASSAAMSIRPITPSIRKIRETSNTWIYGKGVGLCRAFSI